MKKTITIVLMLLFMFSASICGANEEMVDKAYYFYNKGMMHDAIEVMKEASGDNPTAGQLYFIGYAYYKLQDFKNARKYFDMSYKVNSDFDPMAK
jgi:tetratricopeptide (TPR) repeat protein